MNAGRGISWGASSFGRDRVLHINSIITTQHAIIKPPTIYNTIISYGWQISIFILERENSNFGLAAGMFGILFPLISVLFRFPFPLRRKSHVNTEISTQKRGPCAAILQEFFTNFASQPPKV